jgi:site-specific DNA-methyltransferase (adenine-specific)
LLNAVPAGSKILDPFAGSGTSGQAALELGQIFTGIELSPEYAKIARNRLEMARDPSTQLPLFLEATGA